VAKIQAKCPDPSVVALDFNSPCAGTATQASLTTCAVGIDRDRVGRMIVTEFGQGPTGLTALAKHITDTNDCVHGPLSPRAPNDYLLENAQIRVVVQDIQRNLFGIGQFGGQIIDADLNRGNPNLERDNFEEWATAINLENVAHYTNLTVINDGSDGQAAVLRATGVDDTLDFLNPSSTVAGLGFNLPASADDQDLPVEVSTDYILEPDVNYVRVETTVTNIGASGYAIFLGEFLNGSGQVNLFQPVNGFGGPLVIAPCPTAAANPCNFVAYSGYNGGSGVSYAYVHEIPGSSTFTTSGVTVPVLGTNVALALVGFAGPNFPLAASGSPGDSVTIKRWFVIGDGSVSSLTDARNQIQTIGTGTIAGNVTLGGSPVAGAQVSVLGILADAPVSTGKNVVTQALTDATGHYSLTVAPGAYTVEAAIDG